MLLLRQVRGERGAAEVQRKSEEVSERGVRERRQRRCSREKKREQAGRQRRKGEAERCREAE